MLAAALGTILAADFLLHRREPAWLLGGLLDEPAHLATAAIVLANLPTRGEAWTGGFAAGAVAVDVDHVPLIRFRHSIRKHLPRPPLHTLLTPAGLGAGAYLTRGRAREKILGLAAGTCAHFLRDAGTGSGLAPLQPLSRRCGKVPYAAYLLAVGLLARRAWQLAR